VDGRIIAMVVMVVGIGFLSVLTATIASRFIQTDTHSDEVMSCWVNLTISSGSTVVWHDTFKGSGRGNAPSSGFTCPRTHYSLPRLVPMP
jgi:hypothetical protein